MCQKPCWVRAADPRATGCAGRGNFLPPFARPAEFAQLKLLRALATQVRTEAVSTGSRLKAAAISATV